MTEPATEPIEAMIARVERSYARDPDFVFEADGSPLEKFAYRHVRHLWFAELGRVTAKDKGGRPIEHLSLALYDAVCAQWEDGATPPPDVLRRVGADLLPNATSKMLRKRFDAAQRQRHRERFRELVQSRGEAELLLRKVAGDLERQEAALKARAAGLDAQGRQLAEDRAKFDQSRREWEDWNQKKTADANKALAEAQRILVETQRAPNHPQTQSALKGRD